MMLRSLVAVLSASCLIGSIVSAADKVPLTEAQTAAIAQIRKSGGQVMELAQNDARLDIAFHLADGKITDEQLIPIKVPKSGESLF